MGNIKLHQNTSESLRLGLLLAFLCGAVLGGVLTVRFNERSVWAAVLILLISFGMLFTDGRRKTTLTD